MMGEKSDELVGLIRDHLSRERELARSLDELNGTMKQALAVSGNNVSGSNVSGSNVSGSQGPGDDVIQSLAPISERVQQQSMQTAQARRELLNKVNARTGKQYSSLKAVIQSIAPGQRGDLDKDRQEILQNASNAQADLVGNQAVLYYLFDFHRKYLAGILLDGTEGQKYRPDGQSNEVPPGNLVKKAC